MHYSIKTAKAQTNEATKTGPSPSRQKPRFLPGAPSLRAATSQSARSLKAPQATFSP
jgi:hypothetical protein